MRLLLAPIFAVLMLAGCSHSTQGTAPPPAASQALQQAEKSAIGQVIAARITARTAATKIERYGNRGIIGGPSDGGPFAITNFISKTYVAGLHKIDTSLCPLNYRQAWLDYVHAWERIDQKGTIGAAIDFAEFGLAAHTGNARLAADAMSRRAPETLPLWQKCESIALDHGISPSY